MNIVRTLYKLIVARDPQYRFELLRRLGKILAPAYRFKWPQMEWWSDPVFNEMLAKFGETDGLNADRRWMVHQLMQLVAQVPGDTAECGVYEGFDSYIICKRNQENIKFNRRHFAFDSFEGMSEPLEFENERWKMGDLACDLESVREKLSEFENVDFLKGWIPERFPEVEIHSFCFVHIDVDLYQPTRDSLRFFYPRMNKGGLIVCDDYGFSSCPGATRAIDEFFVDKPEKIISLSGGGGFVMVGKGNS